MAELQVIASGTLEATTPAAVLANLLAYGCYGQVTFIGPQNRHALYLAGGIITGADESLQDALCASLVLENGHYQLSSTSPEGHAIFDPWRALQEAALRILGKERLTGIARALRHARIEPVASPLHDWAQSIPEAAQTLTQTCGRVFSAVERPRMRTLVNLVLLREMGLIDWQGQPPRPLVIRATEPAGVTAPAGRPAPSESAADWEAREVDVTPEEFQREEVVAGNPVSAVETPMAGVLLDGSAFDEGLMFLRQGSLGAAKYRFEDHLQYHADDAEAAAYVTWIELQGDLRDQAARRAAVAALDLALARKRTADLLTFKAGVLRLEGKYHESLTYLDEALRLDARHDNARFERDQVRRRIGSTEWPDVNVEDVRIDAAIILQRRIGGQLKIYSFKQSEIRVGSSDNDDVVVSEAVLPQVARRHCTVSLREGRIWVRRNASLGRVFVNDREIEIRRDVPLKAADCVRLGDGAPSLEFRAFGFNHLHDVSVMATGGIR